jgi:hypothetical protein
MGPRNRREPPTPTGVDLGGTRYGPGGAASGLDSAQVRQCSQGIGGGERGGEGSPTAAVTTGE